MAHHNTIYTNAIHHTIYMARANIHTYIQNHCLQYITVYDELQCSTFHYNTLYIILSTMHCNVVHFITVH